MQVVDFLERPIVSYIVLGMFSVAAALIFFQVGGSVAEVYGQEGTLIEAGFKAGGALGGFVIILLISLRIINSLRAVMPEERRLLKEYILRVREDPLDPPGEGLTCSYRLFDQEAGKWGEWQDIDYVKQGGGLRIYVAEMNQRHIIGVRLKSERNVVWVSEDELAYGVSPIYLKREGTTSAGWGGA